jgi:hypothetical protein
MGWGAKFGMGGLAGSAPDCYGLHHSEFKFRYPSKITVVRRKQRSGQHTLARQKNIQKKFILAEKLSFRTISMSRPQGPQK